MNEEQKYIIYRLDELKQDLQDMKQDHKINVNRLEKKIDGAISQGKIKTAVVSVITAVVTFIMIEWVKLKGN